MVSITWQVIARRDHLSYRGAMATAAAVGRSAARVAAAAPRQSAGSRGRCRDLDAASELYRDRPFDAESRDVILHLAEQLEVPLRARNTLLTAAGFAPVFAERPLDDPALAPARQAIDRLLAAHEPFPAIAIDRHWTLVAGNRAATRLMTGSRRSAAAATRQRAATQPAPARAGPAHRQLEEWRTHLLGRLRRQVDVSADPVLAELLDRVVRLGLSAGVTEQRGYDYAGVIVPLRFVTDAGVLSFFSTTTIFGTPVDVTLSEIALESFFPADAATRRPAKRCWRERQGDQGRSRKPRSVYVIFVSADLLPFSLYL